MSLKRLTGFLCIGILAMGLLPAFVYAQERFVTQSGGRGLQNAKMSARVARSESNIGLIFEDLEDIEPYARVAIATCSSSDNKLRWTGNSWTCDEETDPTVMDFAKSALPSCADGTSLSARNGHFQCVEDAGVLTETDPTVMDFAKTTLPSCSSGQILTANGTGFTCVFDDSGVSVETDPTVKPFAQTSLPVCGSGEVLKSNGSSFFCVADDKGISVETDPATMSFARNDVEGYTFAACPENYVLTTNEDGSQLACVADQGSAADSLALGDLSDVDTSGAASGLFLVYDGAGWVAGAEQDPTVQAFAKDSYVLAACGAGQVLTTNADATQLMCADDAGGANNPLNLSDLGDVNILAPVNGQLLRWNGTNWVNSTDRVGVLTNAKWCRASGSQVVCDLDAPSACGASEVLGWDGSSWTCTDVSSGLASAIDLGDLGDVTISSAQSDQVLRYNGTRWQNSDDKIGTLTNNKWCTSDGSEITCGTDEPVTCASPNVIQWTGATWQCVDVAAGVSGNISLTDLSDVDTTGAIAGQVLMFNGSAWVDATLNQIAQGDSAVVVADTGTGAVQIQVDGGAVVHVDDQGHVGVGTVDPQTELEVAGTVSATNLTLSGNLQVSGDITTDNDLTVGGTTFSQGGISTTTVSATTYYGDGSNLVGVTAASTDRLVSGTTSVVAAEDSSITFNTAGTDRMVIGEDGKVGIGTDSPAEALDVSGTISAKYLDIGSGLLVKDGAWDKKLYAPSGGSVFGASTQESLNDRSFGLTVMDPLGFDSGFHTGAIYITEKSDRTRGFFLDVDPHENLAIIKTSKTGAAAGARPGLSFRTGVSAMRITNAGNVGIGTDSPAYTLDVSGTTNISGDLTVGGNIFTNSDLTVSGVTFSQGGISATGDVSATNFYGDGSNLTNVTASNSSAAGNTGEIQFKGLDGLLDASNTLVWDNTNGRLGIGTSSPTDVLEVNGNAKISSSITAGDSVYADKYFVNQNGQGLSWNNRAWVKGDGGSNPALSLGVYNHSEVLKIVKSGNVGIGTITPAATLDVSGTVKVAGTGSETCDSTAYGTMRYNATKERMEMCRP